MAARKTRQETPENPEIKSWTPDRPMGLAHALQKAGYGTRQAAGEIVSQGRVMVDNKVVKDPTFMIEPGCDLKLDKTALLKVEPTYFAFNKPARVVCAKSDGPDRRQVTDFIPPNIPGLTTAGRMDSKTTGLLLVSNDPTWNNGVAESATMEHEYRIQVEGELTEIEISVITAGIHMPNLGIFRPASVKIVEKLNGRTVIIMVTQGTKARMVRRMFSTLRHNITLLRRIRIGDIRLGNLPSGGLRHLTSTEISSVSKLAPATGRTRN